MTQNPVVEITQLSRRFGDKDALTQLNLTVEPGQVYGIVGENGAGKTTLMKHILGLLKAQQGAVRVFGLDPVHQPRAVLARIGYLSEQPDLPGWMRVGELWRYLQAFYPTWDQAYAEELTQTFELDPGKKIGQLSKGQRARTGLVAAQAHRPDLLLLDEPSSGLDPIVRRDILGAVIRTVVDAGRTVVFSSHLLDEVQQVSDQVVMISAGKQVLAGPMDTILGDHHKLVLQRAKEADQSLAPSLSRQLRCEGWGRNWQVIGYGEPNALEEDARQSGWTVVRREGVSLDEVFVARSGRRATEEAA